MNNAVVSLGSNLGDRLSNLSAAIDRISALPCRLLKSSSVYETAPWGNTHQPSFLNQVIEVETGHDVSSLMTGLLSVEEALGRKRMQKWEPRVIDLDILFFNEDIVETEKVVIPHRHLHERRFVLEPLHEILPLKVHPGLKKNISRLLEELNDTGESKKIAATGTT